MFSAATTGFNFSVADYVALSNLLDDTRGELADTKDVLSDTQAELVSTKNRVAVIEGLFHVCPRRSP